jgi:phospholipid-binding lipoprotein MlaA
MTSRVSSRAVRYVQIALLLCIAALAGCASTSQPVDRFEPVNRPIFGVNVRFDDYTLGPVARGWIRITPQEVRDSITRAYRNLTFPDRFVSCLGQVKLRCAGSELARFLLDSTLGIGGFLDPASELPLPKCEEDVGRMLATWGVPAGSYLVIPFVGPSNVRDLAGGIADLLLNPLTWTNWAGMGAGAIFAINGRAQDEWEIQTAKKNALDYYVSVRDAYIQRRNEPEFDTPPDEIYEPLREDRPGPLRTGGEAPQGKAER